jgi:hypothetical protein
MLLCQIVCVFVCVCVQRPWLTSILGAGNVVPLDRRGLIDQPLFQLFHHKLSQQGKWCHIFPEGRIWQNWRFDHHRERVLGPFKWGVGKLIAHSYPNIPIVLPTYHKGMSHILPEIELLHLKKGLPSVPQSIVPKIGRDIDYFIGEPIDFTEKVARFHQQYPGLLQQWKSSLPALRLYGEIAEEIRKQVLCLEAEAYNRPRPARPSAVLVREGSDSSQKDPS